MSTLWRASIARRTLGAIIEPGVLLACGSAAFVTAVSIADGGFFPREWRAATLFLLCVSAVALLFANRIELSMREIAAAATLSGLTIWTRVSELWSSDPSRTRLEADRDLVYVAALLAVLLVVQAGMVAYLLRGLLAGITILCAFAFGQYLYSRPSVSPLALLSGPIAYSNALGAMSAIGVTLAFGLGWTRFGGLRRQPAIVSGLVLVPTLVLTQSRGAWVSLAFGLTLTVALLPRQ